MSRKDADALQMNLAFQSKELLQFLNGRLPSAEEIEALTREKGVEFTTTFLHRALLQSSLQSDFIRHVQSLAPSRRRAEDRRLPIEVVVVPSVTWGARLQWGNHVDWVRKTARELGFTTDVIDTIERESLTGNARIIGQYLEAAPTQRMILVTYGRGTSEFRMLLQKRGRLAPEFRNIRAWISIGGSYYGSRLSEQALRRPLDRFETRFDFWLNRRKFAALQEVSSEFPLWRERTLMPDSMMVISAVGLPLKHQLPLHLWKSYDRLSAFGPNDGAVLATEAMIRPGMVYPVPGMSHQVDEVIMKPVLERLLNAVERVVRESDERTRDLLKPDLEREIIQKSRARAGFDLDF